MEDDPTNEVEPEARKEESKPESEEGKEVPMRDEGLNRSASGALRPLGDNPE